MSAIAQIKDGKVVETGSQNSIANAVKGSGGNGMDKDTFLQLLVAQMKYQDPLEPTSNTEYISQYATFSQVEQMQNMAGSMELSRASQLVGQDVWIKTTDASGQSQYIQGKVDYVVYENGKAYVSVNENLYAVEDVDTVVDREYNTAFNLATDLVNRIFMLPGINGVDLSDCDEIDRLEKIYNDMSDYQKQFVAKDAKDALDAYIEKAKEVRLAADNADNADKPEKPDEGDEGDS